MSPRPSLSPKQAQYVAMTCQGQTNSDIAKALGVDRKTITRWSKLPQIQSAIAEGNAGSHRGIGQAQEESYRQLAKSTTQTTMELVEKYTPAAIKTVVLILGKNDAKDSDKLRAAELLTKWAGIGQTANFQEYRSRWGALQAHGMFCRMMETNDSDKKGDGSRKKQNLVMQPVRDRMIADLQQVYRENLATMQSRWNALGRGTKDPVATRKAIHAELLRFRGGSALQAAVWDDEHFYTYDLLRLLPYAEVELVEPEKFLKEATKSGHIEEEFPKEHNRNLALLKPTSR